MNTTALELSPNFEIGTIIIIIIILIITIIIIILIITIIIISKNNPGVEDQSYSEKSLQWFDSMPVQ